jgi:hypothetical protein
MSFLDGGCRKSLKGLSKKLMFVEALNVKLGFFTGYRKHRFLPQKRLT